MTMIAMLTHDFCLLEPRPSMLEISFFFFFSSLFFFHFLLRAMTLAVYAAVFIGWLFFYLIFTMHSLLLLSLNHPNISMIRIRLFRVLY